MIYLLLGLLVSCALSATERITDFNSDITVHKDGSMTVTETIKVKGEADQIRRGIVRELPTQYKDRMGNYYNVGFDILEIKRDGQRAPYHVETASNGKKVYIGSKETFLGIGYYTFDITYKTNRQLGFFNDHDELYWNVTGNGWRLPIDHASATVHLPSEIPTDKIKVEGYTGYQGSKAQHYIARVQADGDAYFQTTKPLNREQGLTIVTSFPKGYIEQPSFIQSWWWFFNDNLHLFIAALGLLLLIVFYWWASIQVAFTQQMGTVIPLFYPPKNMTPGLVRYITNMKYDSKVLAADMVDMAVRGYLTIEYKPGLMWGGGYILNRKKKSTDMSLYSSLYQKLFGKKKSIVLSRSSASILGAVINSVKSNCEKEGGLFFDSHGFYTLGGVGISIVTILAMLRFVDRGNSVWLLITGALFLLIIFVMAVQFRGYTKKGLLVKKEIDGFRMFLKTTEEERFKLIGSPPTKTPELYETYLPYAIALGVEDQWSRQFAPMFEEMAAAGEAYTFIWISGGRYDHFGSSRFASNISNGISSSVSSASISSSSSTPGSSSGSGGGGSSGGGGGGGGGGGW